MSKDINDAELDYGVNLLFPAVLELFSNFQVSNHNSLLFINPARGADISNCAIMIAIVPPCAWAIKAA